MQPIIETSQPSPAKKAKVQDREWQIASAAYYLSEKRGFSPGRELEDWFRAEKAILAGHSDPEKMSGPVHGKNKSKS